MLRRSYSYTYIKTVTQLTFIFVSDGWHSTSNAYPTRGLAVTYRNRQSFRRPRFLHQLSGNPALSSARSSQLNFNMFGQILKILLSSQVTHR